MVEIVYFYKGEESHYSYFKTPPTDEHRDGLFFATDTHRLYLNGKVFGRGKNGIVNIEIKNSLLKILFEDGKTTVIDLSNAISVATPDEAGLLSIDDKNYIDHLRDTLNDALDDIREDIADAKTYSIIQVTDSELKTLGSNIKEAFKLIDEDGTQVGDYIKIYKDSALKQVEVVDENLRFTYELEDGTNSTVDVDISKFLSESEFKDGLNVNEGVVSVKLSESGKNFLILEENGKENKSLAVRELDADCLKLDKSITVAGLSGQFGAGNYKNGDVIDANTDIYTILQNLLCKELWPTITSSQGSATASMSSPTITFSPSGTVEVGTPITVTAKTGTCSVSAKNSSISGLTYGYSTSNDNEKDSTSNSISKTTTTAVSDNNYTIDLKKGNSSVKTGNGTGSASVTYEFEIAENTTTFSASATGASYKYSVPEIPTIYGCSNLGNTKTEYSRSVSAASGTTSKPTATGSASVTGRYKYYMGFGDYTTIEQLNSNIVKSLSKSGWINGSTTVVGSTAIKSNGQSIIVACPSKYKLNTVNNGIGADIFANFSVSGTVSVKIGGTSSENYNVYIYPITNGAIVEFKNLTIN